MSRRLSRQRRDWDDLATLDPYWAILTDPERKHGRWDRESFLDTGTREVDAMLTVAAELGLPAMRGKALDFGCGLGRLTRALARHFDEVTGVDISERLVAQARQLAVGIPSCDFRVSSGEDLSMFADRSLDLVYSNIVLQHQPSRRLIRKYLAEFIRIVDVGGLVVFQLPTAMPLHHRVQPRRRIYSALRRLGVPPGTLYRRLRLDPMRMTFMPGEDVVMTVENAGGHVLDAREDVYGAGFPSMTYFVTRESQPV
jgi:SAM-dependent methyltransferase